MPRKAFRSVDFVDDDAPSQCSKPPDSDDRDIEVYAKAVAEFKVTWQKQKKAKERKFLKAAHAELDQHVDRKRGEVDQIINEMEEAYKAFLSEYAALEDKKREVLLKIVDAQKSLVALSVRKHQQAVELAHDREEGALEGIKQVKQSWHDMAGMVEGFMEV